MKLAKARHPSIQASPSTKTLARDEILTSDLTQALGRSDKARYLTVPDVEEKPPAGGGGGGGGGSTGGSGGSTNSGSEVDGAVRRRKNQSALSSNEWDRLIEAMKCLMHDKGSRNWDYFAETHAKYGSHGGNHDLPHHNGEDLDIHDDVYWLPWHRKFILEFEKRLRDFDSSIELPYWNWVYFREIPQPLHAKIGGWMHVSRAVFHPADKLPTVAELNQVKSATTFETFDSLLNNLHGRVHNWVGGTMANPATSAEDPLFFLHHCFIDKLWADWQATHHPSLFPSDYREMNMPPWDLKVEDVLYISKLGYEIAP